MYKRPIKNRYQINHLLTGFYIEFPIRIHDFPKEIRDLGAASGSLGSALGSHWDAFGCHGGPLGLPSTYNIFDKCTIGDRQCLI